MKYISTIIALILLSKVTYSQINLPILKSNQSNITYQIDDEKYIDGWTIDPELETDVFDVYTNKTIVVSFISKIDSIEFKVKPGKTYDFLIQQDDSIFAKTQINAIKPIQKAKFSKSYIKANDKKISIEIPEVYELVNILIALTETGKENNSIIGKHTDYYNKVIKYFSRFEDEEIVQIVDSLIKPNLIYHCELKLDAYSFYFDKHNQISPSKVYQVTSRENFNTLKPYIKLIQDFSDKSNFRNFYKENNHLYQNQISFYKDSANIEGMFEWLKVHFPNPSRYAIRIVFSPLVSGWQNANTIYDNNFSEVFAHVNYPDFQSDDFSEKSNALRRGVLVFTELNHHFLNNVDIPEDSETIEIAINDLTKWLDKETANNYNDARACFDEYMNWALVSLWFLENAPKDELPNLIKENEEFMTERRKFIRFEDFNHYLMNLYKNKGENQNISDLYPQIIKWFKNN